MLRATAETDSKTSCSDKLGPAALESLPRSRSRGSGGVTGSSPPEQGEWGGGGRVEKRRGGEAGGGCLTERTAGRQQKPGEAGAL